MERGLCEGEVLYHSYVTKTAEEVRLLGVHEGMLLLFFFFSCLTASRSLIHGFVAGTPKEQGRFVCATVLTLRCTASEHFVVSHERTSKC